jgi:hypothetical protein
MIQPLSFPFLEKLPAILQTEFGFTQKQTDVLIGSIQLKISADLGDLVGKQNNGALSSKVYDIARTDRTAEEKLTETQQLFQSNEELQTALSNYFINALPNYLLGILNAGLAKKSAEDQKRIKDQIVQVLSDSVE